MKKILLLIAGLWVAGAVSARELVVTLHGGQRLAFHLSATDEVLMTQTADQVMLNGMALERANIAEMRVFQQRPEDAIAVGVLAPEAELRTGSLMSHVMLFEVPGYHKLLGVTDGGMCTYPDLEKKVGIVKNAVQFFHKIGVEKPNVAALCAIETINPKMQETVDGDALKQMSLNGELGECYVEGPISYDLAMVPELSEVKGYTACPCCGDFDILLVPEIVVGNVLGKCLTYTCGGRMAGLIMGCKVPIVLTSRGSSAEEKYYSLAMGAGFVGE